MGGRDDCPPSENDVIAAVEQETEHIEMQQDILVAETEHSVTVLVSPRKLTPRDPVSLSASLAELQERITAKPEESEANELPVNDMLRSETQVNGVEEPLQDVISEVVANLYAVPAVDKTMEKNMDETRNNSDRGEVTDSGAAVENEIQSVQGTSEGLISRIASPSQRRRMMMSPSQRRHRISPSHRGGESEDSDFASIYGDNVYDTTSISAHEAVADASLQELCTLSAEKVAEKMQSRFNDNSFNENGTHSYSEFSENNLLDCASIEIEIRSLKAKCRSNDDEKKFRSSGVRKCSTNNARSSSSSFCGSTTTEEKNNEHATDRAFTQTEVQSAFTQTEVQTASIQIEAAAKEVEAEDLFVNPAKSSAYRGSSTPTFDVGARNGSNNAGVSNKDTPTDEEKDELSMANDEVVIANSSEYQNIKETLMHGIVGYDVVDQNTNDNNVNEDHLKVDSNPSMKDVDSSRLTSEKAVSEKASTIELNNSMHSEPPNKKEICGTASKSRPSVSSFELSRAQQQFTPVKRSTPSREIIGSSKNLSATKNPISSSKNHTGSSKNGTNRPSGLKNFVHREAIGASFAPKSGPKVKSTDTQKNRMEKSTRHLGTILTDYTSVRAKREATMLKPVLEERGPNVPRSDPRVRKSDKNDGSSSSTSSPGKGKDQGSATKYYDISTPATKKRSLTERSFTLGTPKGDTQVSDTQASDNLTQQVTGESVATTTGKVDGCKDFDGGADRRSKDEHAIVINAGDPPVRYDASHNSTLQASHDSGGAKDGGCASFRTGNYSDAIVSDNYGDVHVQQGEVSNGSNVLSKESSATMVSSRLQRDSKTGVTNLVSLEPHRMREQQQSIDSERRSTSDQTSCQRERAVNENGLTACEETLRGPKCGEEALEGGRDVRDVHDHHEDVCDVHDHYYVQDGLDEADELQQCTPDVGMNNSLSYNPMERMDTGCLTRCESEVMDMIATAMMPATEMAEWNPDSQNIRMHSAKWREREESDGDESKNAISNGNHLQNQNMPNQNGDGNTVSGSGNTELHPSNLTGSARRCNVRTTTNNRHSFDPAPRKGTRQVPNQGPNMNGNATFRQNSTAIRKKKTDQGPKSSERNARIELQNYQARNEVRRTAAKKAQQIALAARNKCTFGTTKDPRRSSSTCRSARNFYEDNLCRTPPTGRHSSRHGSLTRIHTERHVSLTRNPSLTRQVSPSRHPSPNRKMKRGGSIPCFPSGNHFGDIALPLKKKKVKRSRNTRPCLLDADTLPFSGRVNKYGENTHGDNTPGEINVRDHSVEQMLGAHMLDAQIMNHGYQSAPTSAYKSPQKNNYRTSPKSSIRSGQKMATSGQKMNYKTTTPTHDRSYQRNSSNNPTSNSRTAGRYPTPSNTYRTPDYESRVHHNNYDAFEKVEAQIPPYQDLLFFPEKAIVETGMTTTPRIAYSDSKKREPSLHYSANKSEFKNPLVHSDSKTQHLNQVGKLKEDGTVHVTWANGASADLEGVPYNIYQEDEGNVVVEMHAADHLKLYGQNLMKEQIEKFRKRNQKKSGGKKFEKDHQNKQWTNDDLEQNHTEVFSMKDESSQLISAQNNMKDIVSTHIELDADADLPPDVEVNADGHIGVYTKGYSVPNQFVQQRVGDLGEHNSSKEFMAADAVLNGKGACHQGVVDQAGQHLAEGMSAAPTPRIYVPNPTSPRQNDTTPRQNGTPPSYSIEQSEVAIIGQDATGNPQGFGNKLSHKPLNLDALKDINKPLNLDLKAALQSKSWEQKNGFNNNTSANSVINGVQEETPEKVQADSGVIGKLKRFISGTMLSKGHDTAENPTDSLENKSQSLCQREGSGTQSQHQQLDCQSQYQQNLQMFQHFQTPDVQRQFNDQLAQGNVEHHGANALFLREGRIPPVATAEEQMPDENVNLERHDDDYNGQEPDCNGKASRPPARTEKQKKKKKPLRNSPRGSTRAPTRQANRAQRGNRPRGSNMQSTGPPLNCGNRQDQKQHIVDYQNQNFIDYPVEDFVENQMAGDQFGGQYMMQDQVALQSRELSNQVGLQQDQVAANLQQSNLRKGLQPPILNPPNLNVFGGIVTAPTDGLQFAPAPRVSTTEFGTQRSTGSELGHQDLKHAPSQFGLTAPTLPLDTLQVPVQHKLNYSASTNLFNGPHLANGNINPSPLTTNVAAGAGNVATGAENLGNGGNLHQSPVPAQQEIQHFDDPIDRAIHLYCTRVWRLYGREVLCQKLTDGVYRFGISKSPNNDGQPDGKLDAQVFVTHRGNNILVRVGGGFKPLHQYLDKKFGINTDIGGRSAMRK